MKHRIHQVVAVIAGLAALLCLPALAQPQVTNDSRVASPQSEELRVWGAETNGLQLSLTLSKTSYSVGESIWAKMVLRNISEKVKKVHETLQISDFKFSIIGPDGGQVPLTSIGKQRQSSIITQWNSERELKPKQEMWDEHRIDEVWDMTQPGKYRITAIRPVSLDDWMALKAKGVPLAERFAYVTSNTVEIEVAKKQDK